MANVPTGTRFHVAPGFNAAKTVTAVSNAALAVIQSVAHGFANGTPLLFTSGWGRLNNRIFEVQSAAADQFTIKLNSLDTNFFPAGAGVGTIRSASSLVELTKLMNPQTQGGNPKNVPYKFLDSDVEYSINDGFEATSYTLEMDDDDTTPGFAALDALTEVQIDTFLKMTMRNGTRIYIPGRAALNSVPQLQEGQINRIRCAFNGNGRHTRYSA